ncbi:MAG: EamA family transporter [Candidatus Levybacteria bacterium]|nr:EamA family transporter [Candidatus Levybacteria bacterium]
MWFWLALFFALCSSGGIFIAKKVLKDTDVLVYISFGNLISAILVGAFIFFQGFPQIDSSFLLAVLIAAGLGIFVNLSYISAIKLAPISLTAPMASFTPIVAMIFGFLLLSENVSVVKLLGVLAIVLGAYLLNIADIKGGFAKPFKSLFSNRGVLLMLLAQSLVGITPIFEKTAIFHTKPQQPLMVAFGELVLLTIFFFPLLLFKTKKAFFQFKRHLLWFILPAPITVLSYAAGYTAYSLANVGYVTAVFKLSTIFTIFLGAMFFGEKHIKERLLGASVMLAGTILLVL